MITVGITIATLASASNVVGFQIFILHFTYFEQIVVGRFAFLHYSQVFFCFVGTVCFSVFAPIDFINEGIWPELLQEVPTLSTCLCHPVCL